MDTIHTKFEDKIKALYNKSGYLDKYGGSVVACGLLVFAFFTAFSYLYVMNHLKPIKSDWINQRCNPSVIPFAGMINAKPGESKVTFTADNFTKCTTDVLTKVVEYFLTPIYYVSNLVVKLFNQVGNAVQNIREIVAYIRKQIDAIARHIMLRIFGLLVPIQKMVIKFRDMLNKMGGIMATTLYTAIAAYMALKAFIGAFLQLIIIALVIAAAMIIAMWILPFTWGAAAAGTVFFMIIMVPVALIAGWMVHILNITSKSVPKKPGCFDKNTLIKVKYGEKKISELKINDKLSDNSLVTAIFKLSYYGQDIYNLNNIIVTGSHKIFHNNELISISEHPGATKLKNYNEEFVYCINTSNKKIIINNNVFADWDDIEEIDLVALKKMKLLPIDSSYEHIHTYLDGGFHENTLIELEDGRSKKINDIDVNEQLKFGQRVLGTVKIDAQRLHFVKKFTINDSSFIGGVNLQINDNLGKITTLNILGEPSKTPRYLYHLITDTGKFTIDGLEFFDYSGGIEQILDFPQTLFKSF